MELKEIATMRAVAMLKASKCTFIIVKENGEVITEGDLKLAEPEPERKRLAKVPFKTYWNVYHPILSTVEAGQSTAIPYGGLDPEGLQSAVSAWCSTNWGHGATMTHKGPEALEVMRIS